MRCAPSRMGVVEAVAKAVAYAKRRTALVYIFVEVFKVVCEFLSGMQVLKSV